MPGILNEGATPLQVKDWIEKFYLWPFAAVGKPEAKNRAAPELKLKLESDWKSHLSGTLKWSTASYEDMLKVIIEELSLTRQTLIFGKKLEKGELLKECIIGAEDMANIARIYMN